MDNFSLSLFGAECCGVYLAGAGASFQIDRSLGEKGSSSNAGLAGLLSVLRLNAMLPERQTRSRTEKK